MSNVTTRYIAAPAPRGIDKVHFVGIGGAGMSGIARILLARGVPVSGSDARESPGLAALRACGAVVHVGHDSGNLGDARTVVVSNAIRESNAELRAARDQGLRVIPRAAALAEVMAGRHGVAVTGTAGKTSTTAMLTTIASACGADPSFAVGVYSTNSASTRATVTAGCSSRRPTRVTAPSCFCHQTRRQSPTSAPMTISTCTAPRSGTRRRSNGSSTGSRAAGSS
jgi:hypothetical protein